MVKRALAIEDGNLNTPSIITSRKVDYSDIDLTFTVKPSGDLYKKIDAAAVKQAVKNVLMTSPGEKPFSPHFGAGLNGLLFELADDDIELELDVAIRQAIQNYEPRADVQDVIIQSRPESNKIGIQVIFKIVNSNEVVVLQTSLARIR